MVVLLLGIRFPVPSFWIQTMKNASAQEGLVIEIDEATFTLGGNVRIRNARLKATAKDLPSLCFIRSLDANFKIGSFLMGDFMPTDAKMEDAWLMASGQERNAVMENLSGTLHFREEIVRFAFEGWALSTRLDLRGFLNTEKAFSKRKVPHKKTSILFREDFSEMYWQVIKWSKQTKALLAKVEQPIIGVHIAAAEQCNIRILGESGVLKLGSHEVATIHCSTDTEINVGKEIESSLFLEASKLHLETSHEKVGIGRIKARVVEFKYNSQEITALPRIDAKLEGLSLTGKFDGRLPSIHLEATPSGKDILALFAAMGTRESRIIFTGTAKPLERDLQGNFYISARPQDLNSATIKQWAKKQMLLTPYPITATVGPIRLQDGNFSGSQFIIKADELVIRDSSPAKYLVHGEINSDKSILAHDIYGKLKHSEVRGSFQQNWASLDFRFLLEGRCMPTELNPWLRDWWTVIWQDFSWDNDIPYGDFDIQGQWLNNKKRTKTYGAVEVSNISYRDLPLNKGSLKVVVGEKKTEITEINLLPPMGKIEGNLFFPRSSPSQPLILGFDLNGEINPTHCHRTFGPVAEKALKRFDTNSTVNVSAQGQILLNDEHDHSDRKDLTKFKIQANSHNPIRFSRMPLEYLSLNLKSSADLTHVEKLDFGIAGGRGSGTLLFNEEQNGSELAIDLTITKANRSDFVEIMSLSDAFSEDIKSSPKSSAKDIRDGILNLSLNASGHPDEIWSFEGNGSLLIQDKALHEIPIFSFLAKKLAKIKLFGITPLAGLKGGFTELDAPFALSGERAIFKNLNLTGPTSLLVAKGEVNLAEGLLDLEARFHLLGNLPMVSKLTQLADPLSALGNIKIGGSFDEPKWNVQFRPGKAPIEVLFPKGAP